MELRQFHRQYESTRQVLRSYSEGSRALNFIQRKILALEFSYEFHGISQNSFVIEHLWIAASDNISCIL